MPPVALRIHAADLFLTTCRTRLPFRFGISTMTWAPLATLRVRIETSEGTYEGASSDLLVPKWFEKDPAKSLREDLANLIGSVNRAVAVASDPHAVPSSAFDHWLRIHRRCAAEVTPKADPLVHGFGVALVERAMIDATCRAAGCSFFTTLKRERLGFEPSAVNVDLAGWSLSDALPERPAQTIRVRHTVGLVDALRSDEIRDDDRVADGLPETLEEDIVRFGLTHFKLKLCGDAETDERRLLEIASVFEERVSGQARFTLDGNEQFESLESLANLLDRVAATTRGRTLLDGLLYIEQPLPRKHTFDTQRNAAIARITPYGALIIDEADAALDSFRRAVELGYRGVSVKNCKGVFRAMLNFGLCARSGGELFQSSEDLTNLPILALQQDLATAAALGLPHSERNGHHYFLGLAHLPPAEATAAVAAHADLYEADAAGPRLRIENGVLTLGSLDCLGYGYNTPVDWDARTPASRWTFPENA